MAKLCNANRTGHPVGPSTHSKDTVDEEDLPTAALPYQNFYSLVDSFFPLPEPPNHKDDLAFSKQAKSHFAAGKAEKQLKNTEES